MALGDRDYARADRSWGVGGATTRALSVNGWIITINVAVFLAQVFLFRPSPRAIGSINVGPMDALAWYGHLSTAFFPLRWEFWRLLTFQFLHAHALHLFFNMFGLWMFGSVVEQHLGRKRYAAFYLTCGIFGGATYMLLNLIGWQLTVMYPGIRLPPFLFDDPTTPLVGASAGVFGVIFACAYIAPNAVVQLLFPPVPLRMTWLAYGYFALAVINLLSGGRNAGGDAAHVGGAIAGYYFIRHAHLLRDFFDVFGDSRRPPRPPRSPHRSPRARPGPPPEEVERILAKIHEQGLASLSEREKRTLAAASEAERRERG